MSLNLVILLYLVASVCFIQALKGLSHPTTSRAGNVFGMVGMAIAMVTTVALIYMLAPQMATVGMGWILLGLVVNNAILLVPKSERDAEVWISDATPLAALGAVQAQGLPHARCVGLIETCEESGSYDLPAYLDHLAPRIGEVDFVVGLDSGCGDYQRLWVTTSLRGLAAGTLAVEVLTEGVHSGDASGIVPSSFRIARALLDRLEDVSSGRILPSDFHAPIPDERIEQARVAADILGEALVRKYPFAGRTAPMASDRVEALLNRTWRPALSVTGADGLPAIASAGNVLRPRTALKLSLRLPPTLAGEVATAAMKRLLEADPPYGAGVSFEPDQGATGWNAPATAPWLATALDGASRAFYGMPAGAMGEGGTIPFMGMLGRKFPAAQFLITGVLGPQSNAHGPNEFLHVPYAKKLTACVASVLAAHAAQS